MALDLQRDLAMPGGNLRRGWPWPRRRGGLRDRRGRLFCWLLGRFEIRRQLNIRIRHDRRCLDFFLRFVFGLGRLRSGVDFDCCCSGPGARSFLLSVVGPVKGARSTTIASVPSSPVTRSCHT